MNLEPLTPGRADFLRRQWLDHARGDEHEAQRRYAARLQEPGWNLSREAAERDAAELFGWVFLDADASSQEGGS